MLRRRLIIEWDDDGCDTDEDCARDFLNGEWSIEDLKGLAEPFRGQPGINLKVWVEDAPK